MRRIKINASKRDLAVSVVDSVMAATMLKNPEALFDVMKNLCIQLLPLWRAAYQAFLEIESVDAITPSQRAHIDFIYKVASDACMPGQFVVIGDRDGLTIKNVVASDSASEAMEKIAIMSRGAETVDDFMQTVANATEAEFEQLILMCKAIGSALFDFPAILNFFDASILSEDRKAMLLDYAAKLKPSIFFRDDYRGRQPGVEKTACEEAGILTTSQSATVPISVHERLQHTPYQRLTFANDPRTNGLNIAATLAGFPVVGGPSGSVALFLIAACAAHPDFVIDPEKRRIVALSACAFLVGGGYHSCFECLGMSAFAFDPVQQRIGIAAGSDSKEIIAHKKNEAAYFIAETARTMPYVIDNGYLIFNPACFPKPFLGQLTAMSVFLQREMPSVFESSTSIDRIDFRMRSMLVNSFLSSFTFLMTRRRSAHADEAVYEKMTVFAAMLVSEGLIAKETIQKLLGKQLGFYTSEKTARTEGYDYEAHVQSVNAKKKVLLEKFESYLKDPVLLQAEFLRLKPRAPDVIASAAGGSKTTAEKRAALRSVLSPVGIASALLGFALANPDIQNKTLLLERFSDYVQMVVKTNMVYHDPTPHFFSMHAYLLENDMIKHTDFQFDAVNLFELSRLSEADLRIAGFYLSAKQILEATLQYDEPLQTGDLTFVSLDKLVRQTQLFLLLGSVRNTLCTTPEAFASIQAFIAGISPADLDRKTQLAILEIQYFLRNVNVLFETRTPLEIYKSNLKSFFMTLLRQGNVLESLDLLSASLSYVTADDLASLENVLHGILKELMTADFTIDDQCVKKMNAVLRQLHHLGLLSGEVVLSDKTDLKILRFLYQHNDAGIYPDSTLLTFFKEMILEMSGKTFDEIHDALMATLSSLALPTDPIVLAHLLYEQRAEDLPKIYYLAHFKNDHAYASYAYTYQRFLNDVVAAQSFDRKPSVVEVAEVDVQSLESDGFKVDTLPVFVSSETLAYEKALSEIAKLVGIFNSRRQALKSAGEKSLPTTLTYDKPVDLLAQLEFKHTDVILLHLKQSIQMQLTVLDRLQQGEVTLRRPTNLVAQFRTPDLVSSCLLSRNKRQRMNRVGYELSPETFQYIFKVNGTEGYVSCALGHVYVGDVAVPTLFVNAPAANGKLNTADYHNLMFELEKIGHQLGCYRLQIIFNNDDRDKYDALPGYRKMEAGIYQSAHFELMSSLGFYQDEVLIPWVHDHHDWGERVNTRIDPDARMHQQSLYKDFVLDMRQLPVLPDSDTVAGVSKADWLIYQRNLNHILACRVGVSEIITANGMHCSAMSFISLFHQRAYLILQDYDLSKKAADAMNRCVPDIAFSVIVETFLLYSAPGMMNLIAAEDTKNTWIFPAFDEFLGQCGIGKKTLPLLQKQFSEFIHEYQAVLTEWHHDMAHESQARPKSVAVLTQDGGMTHHLQGEAVVSALGADHCVVFNESRYRDTPIMVATSHSHSWITNEVKSNVHIPDYKEYADLLQKAFQDFIKQFIPDTSREQLVAATYGCRAVVCVNTWAHNVFLLGLPQCQVYFTVDQAHNNVNYCIAPLLHTAQQLHIPNITYLGQPHTIAKLSDRTCCQSISPIIDPAYYQTPTDKVVLTPLIADMLLTHSIDRAIDATKPVIFVSTGGQVAGKEHIESVIAKWGETHNIFILCAEDDVFRARCLAMSDGKTVFPMPRVSNPEIAQMMLYADICFVKPGSPMVNQSVACKQRKPELQFIVLDDNREQEKGNLEVMCVVVGASVVNARADAHDLQRAFDEARSRTEVVAVKEQDVRSTGDPTLALFLRHDLRERGVLASGLVSEVVKQAAPKGEGVEPSDARVSETRHEF